MNLLFISFNFIEQILNSRYIVSMKYKYEKNFDLEISCWFPVPEPVWYVMVLVSFAGLLSNQQTACGSTANKWLPVFCT
jgi:hypothetical protein